MNRRKDLWMVKWLGENKNGQTDGWTGLECDME